MRRTLFVALMGFVLLFTVGSRYPTAKSSAQTYTWGTGTAGIAVGTSQCLWAYRNNSTSTGTAAPCDLTTINGQGYPLPWQAGVSPDTFTTVDIRFRSLTSNNAADELEVCLWEHDETTSIGTQVGLCSSVLPGISTITFLTIPVNWSPASDTRWLTFSIEALVDADASMNANTWRPFVHVY